MDRATLNTVADQVLRRLPARRGHFALESGHHGDLWLDLPLLCLDPEPIRGLADALAAVLADYGVDAVCGPLIEGAFVALMVAERLAVPFTYAEPQPDPAARGLFPVRYRVPPVLRGRLAGRRVAIVNDVINAGSAVRGTLADLASSQAVPVVIGSLAVLGNPAHHLAAEAGLALATLATIANELWVPADCPLCAAGVPLTAG